RQGARHVSDTNTAIAVIGIDVGKNSFHVVGYDARGAIVLRQKWSRGQVEARLANIPPCLIGMEACVGAHPESQSWLSRRGLRVGMRRWRKGLASAFVIRWHIWPSGPRRE